VLTITGAYTIDEIKKKNQVTRKRKTKIFKDKNISMKTHVLLSDGQYSGQILGNLQTSEDNPHLVVNFPIPTKFLSSFFVHVAQVIDNIDFQFEQM
jgi:hypothetical protein